MIGVSVCSGLLLLHLHLLSAPALFSALELARPGAARATLVGAGEDVTSSVFSHAPREIACNLLARQPFTQPLAHPPLPAAQTIVLSAEVRHRSVDARGFRKSAKHAFRKCYFSHLSGAAVRRSARGLAISLVQFVRAWHVHPPHQLSAPGFRTFRSNYAPILASARPCVEIPPQQCQPASLAPPRHRRP